MLAEIKLGQTWKLRNGDTVVITSLVPIDEMPVKAGELCWQSNGRYWDDDFEHKLDLITKIDDGSIKTNV